MCLNYLKIRSLNPSGIKAAFVPCGKCADCRRRKANEWKFRLLSELSFRKKLGWNVAFCTLTYNDFSLPHIPRSCFKRMADYRPLKCFSREDVSNWICSIRHWLKYHFRFVGDKSLMYFVSSEFGSLTHRPHYHAILSWPSELDYERMHSVCSYYWNHGFLFPRHFYGDKGMLSFEVVGDYSKVLSYVSKYVCKDLDFMASIADVELNRGTKVFKKCLPFHLQSRGLGWRSFESLSFADKFRLFSDGQAFLGNTDFLDPLPLYIKNKFIFDNDYIVTNSGRRLVRRKATEFFRCYKDEIFDLKAKYYAEVISNVRQVSFYTVRGIEEEWSKKLVLSINFYSERLLNSFGFDVIGSGLSGKFLLAYYSVPNDNCHVADSHDELVNQWFQRYDDSLLIDSPILDSSCWSDLQAFCSLVLGSYAFCSLASECQHAKDDVMSSKLMDFFNNVLEPLL